jgi:glycogen operon protein
MTLNELITQHRIEWHGVSLGEPDWSDASHSLAATIHLDADSLALHLMMNAYWEPLEFVLPRLDTGHVLWRRCVDTFRASPGDICVWSEAETVRSETLIVQPRSIVVLVTRPTEVETTL